MKTLLLSLIPGLLLADLPERTWTSTDGRTLTGSLVTADDTAATLRIAGRQHEIPLSRLSPADHEYLQLTAPDPDGKITFKTRREEAPDLPSIRIDLTLDKLESARLLAFETHEKRQGKIKCASGYVVVLEPDQKTVRLSAFARQPGDTQDALVGWIVYVIDDQGRIIATTASSPDHHRRLSPIPPAKQRELWQAQLQRLAKK